LEAGDRRRIAGLLVEAVADAQKSAFRSKHENRGRFVASGLWRYSRHPNFFGEMLVWWGLFAYAVAFLDLPRSPSSPARSSSRAPAVRQRDPAARA
jgi:steroid 5-alpha reductase family enzyme